MTRIGYGGAPAAPELVAADPERVPAGARRPSPPRTGSPRPRRSRRRTRATTTSPTPTRSGGPCRRSRSGSSTTTAHDVPVGETGEIWLRGPTIMMPRLLEPTRRDRRGDHCPSGWFRSGDIGRLDADGFLYLVDRAKDMIIRAGENVYCVEIEQVLFEHPDILDAAVVGVPAPRARRRGEGRRAAARRVDRDRRGRARALRRAHLADFKVPEYVELRDEPLPRNPAGKVLKSVLRGDEQPRSRRTPPTTPRSERAGRDVDIDGLRHPQVPRVRRDRGSTAIVGLYALAAWRWKRCAAARCGSRRSSPSAILISGAARHDPRRRLTSYRRPSALPHVLRVPVFVTIGLLYQYRTQMKGRPELLYGLGGLFIMGLGIRAVTPGADVSRAPDPGHAPLRRPVGRARRLARHRGGGRPRARPGALRGRARSAITTRRAAGCFADAAQAS